jgi:predicted RNA-binding Zn-ribbon protein involved in translation (DUF1610 family)
MKMSNDDKADLWKTRRLDTLQIDLDQHVPTPMKIRVQAKNIPSAPAKPAGPTKQPSSAPHQECHSKAMTIAQYRGYTWSIPVGLTALSLAGFFFGRMSKNGETTEAVVFLVVMIVVAIIVHRLQTISVACPQCESTLKHISRSSIAQFLCENCGFQAN